MWFLRLFLLVSLSIFICSDVSRAQDCSAGTSKVAYTITVDQSGRGNFTTVQDAINSVPSHNAQWIQIHINPGMYREQVTILKNKPCILLEGYSSRTTKIVWDAHEQTDTSATFTSYPDNIVAKGITFWNSYNRKLEDNNRTQALAARIYGDKSSFYSCSFLGLQDTLWDVKGRHYFKWCFIEGAVDFIFGSGQSIYRGCSIKVTADTTGYVTAQKRDSPDDPSGFVFIGGSIFGSTGEVYLGRAYGPYSRVIIDGTTLYNVVHPEGWNAWDFVGRESNFTYAEANCRGPGADTSKRVSWEKKLTPVEIAKFRNVSFIDKEGWLTRQP
ncbi:hypothetical protein HHK36_026305 [Tetracentron sinense]|uniref:Pectinesterase n=1 Tax=Tetracentron sinense TaxID=13715 RepID=A0A834YL40_TETSI|nr:hypothetical protein HHK36_026305 [Tetracentron sinense]